MTLAMTLSFAGIFARGIKLKNVAKAPYLTLGLTLEMILSFGRHLKAEMSVLTRVADRLQKLILGFFFSPFHRNSRLLLGVTPTGTFFIGMAHSLSLSAVTIKKALL